MKQKRLLSIGLLVVVAAIVASPFAYRRFRTYQLHRAVAALCDSAHSDLQAGRFPEAEADYKRGIAMAPTDPRPYFGLAVAYEHAARLDLAIATLEQLQNRNPNAPHLWCHLAEAYVGTYDVTREREVAEKAIAVEPECPRALSCYADAEERSRYFDTAAAALIKEERIVPDDVSVTVSLINLLVLKGDYEQAANRADEALKAHPDSAQLHYLTGMSWARMPVRAHAEQTAMEHLKRAVEIAPNWLVPHVELGRLYQSEAKIQPAITEMETALKQSPNHTSVLSSLTALNSLAQLYRQTGNPRAEEIDREFSRLQQITDQITGLRRKYKADAATDEEIVALAQVESEFGAQGPALYHLRRLLLKDPSNAAAQKLYANLDQKARSGYHNDPRPGW
ncbi:MAG TPA: tetratricopeptide repeat protein [Chthonomonadaceae bacterium]|nr:tetratricopeptide repeat protein [Chthonomonadaceae bacterium]